MNFYLLFTFRWILSREGKGEKKKRNEIRKRRLENHLFFFSIHSPSSLPYFSFLFPNIRQEAREEISNYQYLVSSFARKTERELRAIRYRENANRQVQHTISSPLRSASVPNPVLRDLLCHFFIRCTFLFSCPALLSFSTTLATANQNMFVNHYDRH